MAREIKWLLRKAARSKSEYHRNRNYSEHDKGTKKYQVSEDATPKHEGMKKKGSNGWGSIDTTPVKRWLYSQVGKDFNHVYSQFIARVQPKYLEDYKDCIYWYVLEKKLVIMIDGEAYDTSRIRKEQPHPFKLPFGSLRFFIHPDTNILHVASTYVRKKKKRNNEK